MFNIRFAKNVATVLILAATYFVTGKLGLRLAFVHASATAVWPPTGIALAAFLVLGYQVWPGILLGAFLVNLTTAGSAATSMGIAAGNTLEGVLGAYLVSRFAHGRKAFNRARDVLLFALLAGIFSPTVSATLGVTSLAWRGYASWAQYGSIWLTWWLGDAVGALVVAPLLILWTTNPRPRWTPGQALEAPALLLGLLLVGQIVFGGLMPQATQRYRLEFLCIPFLVWAALRFGQREAATAALLLSGIAIRGTLHGLGPFVLGTPHKSLLLLQAFIGVISVMTVAIACFVSERKRVEEALRETHTALKLQVRERTEDVLTAMEALHADVAERRRVEEEMDRFFTLSLDMLCILGFDGYFKRLNPAWDKTLGFRKEDLLARPYIDFVHPDDRQATCAEAKRIIAQGIQVVSFENRFLAQDGSYRWLLWNATPVPKQELVYAAARDITERKHVEDLLRQSEERFRLLVAGVKDYAILRLDTEGCVLSWNRGAEAIQGYKAEEAIGKHFSVFFSPEDRAREKPNQLLEEAKSRGRSEDEGWRVRKDGSRFLANVVITALQNDKGSLLGFAKVTRDLTEQKRAEQTLREAAELERRTTEITVLNRMGSLLQTCLTAEEAYKVIAQFGSELFPFGSGALFVVSESKNFVEEAAAWGDSGFGEPVFHREDCWALRSGRLHWVSDPGSAVICPHVDHFGTSSSLCIPIVAQGDALGILHLRSNLQTSPHGPEDRRGLLASKQELAIAVAEQVGLALANLKLRETLRTQSVRDPLTGLYNRRYMEESLERELRRASRNKQSLGTVMLDLDYFKRTNDTFGHEAGDTLLHELGNFLQAQIRGQDIACRLGGDEFVIILPDAGLEGTEPRAKRLHEGVKHLSVQYRGQPLGRITLSVGVAAFPEHATSADALLRAADLALYRAKTQGRDRVVVAQTTPLHPPPFYIQRFASPEPPTLTSPENPDVK